MEKIPFDIKYRPEIESGKYLVVTRDDRPVRIVCWDRKGAYPIIGLIKDGWREVVDIFDTDGAYNRGEAHRFDLYLVANPDYKEPTAKPFTDSEKDKIVPVIEWTGNNLKEVVEFTGKSPRLEEWFKSWDEYEAYVQEHNNIFKLFNDDGSHYEVPVGAWIVKTPDGQNVASKATFVPSTQEKEATPSEPSEAAVFATMSALKAEFTNYEHFYQCRVKMPSDLGTTTEVWNRGKTPYEAALGVYKRLMAEE